MYAVSEIQTVGRKRQSAACVTCLIPSGLHSNAVPQYLEQPVKVIQLVFGERGRQFRSLYKWFLI
jgi:hypothetical protein